MRTLALLLFFICYTVAVFDPSPITVKDSHGKVLSSFRIQQHGEKQTLYPRIDAFPVTWSLAPEVKGVEMWVDGSIYVYTDTIIPKTTFTISASTSTGNYSLPFDIEVAGCEYGYFTFFKGTGPFIYLFSESKLVYNGTTDSVYLCIPRGEYHFTSPETKAYYFSVFDDNNTHFYSTQYNGFGAPAQGLFSNDIDRPIELLILHLRGEGSATLFVNGAEFAGLTLRVNSSSVLIPSSAVTTGANVIAVLLHKGASSTITFGLSLEATNAPGIPLTDGVATDVQASPDPKHPPANAFQLLFLSIHVERYA